MDKAERDAYIAQPKCPKCGAASDDDYDIEWGMPGCLDVCHSCPDCGTLWREVYVLSRVEVIEQ